MSDDEDQAYYNDYNFECLEDNLDLALEEREKLLQCCSSSQVLHESSDGTSNELIYSPSKTPSKTVQLWTDGETRFLLDKYASYLSHIGPLKKFRNKKEMWKKIGEEIGGKKGQQCEQRYKTVMKRKKNAVENNTTSGAKRQKIQFQEELEKLPNWMIP